MGKITDALNAYDIEKANLDELYRIFKEVDDYDIPIVRFTIYPGARLIRQRINLKGKEFYEISELNYPPAACLSNHGRANLPYQPMFYACSFPNDNESNTPLPRIVSLLETSSFFNDKESAGIERATVSRWDVFKTLNLIALPFCGDYSRPCKDVINFVKAWQDIINDASINPEGLELIQYMSNEMATEFSFDNEYIKVANFVNYLLNINTKTKDADGIIYPSVPAQGGGFNVAVKPDIADAKIRFVGASLCHLLKQYDNSYIAIIKDSLINRDGTITYIDRTQSQDEIKMYEQYANGLYFVN